jgi:hypothetical protein
MVLIPLMAVSRITNICSEPFITYDSLTLVFVPSSSEQVSNKKRITYQHLAYIPLVRCPPETLLFRRIDSSSYVTREKAFEEGLAFWTEDGIPGIQVRPYALIPRYQ